MRTWIAICVVLALGACGGKKDEKKPDLSKMEAGEACRVISKRVFECKDDVIKEVTAALKASSADERTVSGLTEALSKPLPCEGMPAEVLDSLRTCYDPDCKKLAACVVPMALDTARPGGPAPDREPAPAEPKAATGSATTTP